MKKLFCILLVVTMFFAVSGCQGNQSVTPQTSTEPAVEQDVFSISVNDILSKVIENVSADTDIGDIAVNTLTIENEADYISLSVNKFSSNIESAVGGLKRSLQNNITVSLVRCNSGDIFAKQTQQDITNALSAFLNNYKLENQYKGISIQCDKDIFVIYGEKSLVEKFSITYRQTIKSYSFLQYSLLYDDVVFYPEQ